MTVSTSPGGAHHMQSSLFERTILGILTVSVVVITVLLAKREFWNDSPRPRAPIEIADWRSYAVGPMRWGSAEAPVSIVAFSDFQCPYCATFYRSLEELRRKYPEQIAFTYRNYPLFIHPFARGTAIAALCAADQGKFDQFHSHAFEHQDSIPFIRWTDIAATLGVNSASFEACLGDSSVSQRVREDSLDAKRLGVTGTPTVLVNQWRLFGTPTTAMLDSIVLSVMPKSAEQR